MCFTRFISPSIRERHSFYLCLPITSRFVNRRHSTRVYRTTIFCLLRRTSFILSLFRLDFQSLNEFEYHQSVPCRWNDMSIVREKYRTKCGQNRWCEISQGKTSDRWQGALTSWLFFLRCPWKERKRMLSSAVTRPMNKPSWKRLPASDSRQKRNERIRPLWRLFSFRIFIPQ